MNGNFENEQNNFVNDYKKNDERTNASTSMCVSIYIQ